MQVETKPFTLFDKKVTLSDGKEYVFEASSGKPWWCVVSNDQGGRLPVSNGDAVIILEAIVKQKSKCNCGSGCCCKS